MNTFIKGLCFFLLIFTLLGCRQNNSDDSKAQYIHNNFNFTVNDFDSRLKNLNEKILKNPKSFLSIALKMMQTDQFYLTLVDKKHPLPKDLTSQELTELSNYTAVSLNKNNLKLDKKAAESLNSMSLAAKKDGIILYVSSAYRSYSYQKNIFDTYVRKDGRKNAEKYSAPPGCSQHQLGSAVDFGSITNDFAYTPAGKWLKENGALFGWSLSYPKNSETITGYTWESWHWRWIGKDALKMQNTFFDSSQQKLLEFWEINYETLKASYIESD